MANADHLKREIVESLPEIELADENTIYMVGTGAGTEDSVYEEYMLINGGFEKIGSSEVDLTNYALKTYVDQAKAEAISTSGTNTDAKIATKLAKLVTALSKIMLTKQNQMLLPLPILMPMDWQLITQQLNRVAKQIQLYKSRYHYWFYRWNNCR